MITEEVGDIILDVEFDVERQMAEDRGDDWWPPEPEWSYDDVDPSWTQMAQMYTITFQLICHCLERCGLRKETVKPTKLTFNDGTCTYLYEIVSFQTIIQFDAFEFFDRMRIY